MRISPYSDSNSTNNSNQVNAQISTKPQTTGDQYAVFNADGSSTIHYKNGKTKVVNTPAADKLWDTQTAEKTSSAPTTGDKYAVLNDDGSTTVYNKDGSTQVYNNSDNESSSDEISSDELTQTNRQLKANQNSSTPELKSLVSEWKDLVTNGKKMPPADFAKKRETFVKSKSTQALLNKCLGQPGKGLSQTGRITTPDGTVIAATAKKDIYSHEYYWDIVYAK